MPQHDMNIANQGFPAFRADLNDALGALVSNNSGATAPATTFAHQYWVDTSANPSVLKIRNADNDAFITIGTINQTADTFTLTAAVSATTLNTSGQVVFNDAGANVDFRVEGDTDANLLFVDASADKVGIGTSAPTGRLTIYGGETHWGQSTSNGFLGTGGGNIPVVGSIGALPFSFFTNGEERMRIDSAGNVGIGVTPVVTASVTELAIGSAGTARISGVRDGVDAFLIQSTFNITDINERRNLPMRFATNNFERMRIGASGEMFFLGVGTTASGANAFLNSGSSPANELLRSTSSIRYKTDVETLDPAKSEAILNFRPVWYRSLAEADRKDWSWYGLIAEEVAEIEPRLVHWSYPESEYEELETEVEQERTVTDEEGNETTETYTETKTERKLKEDAQLAPDSVQYDRLTVLLLDVVKRQDASIKALEARIAALEAQ